MIVVLAASLVGGLWLARGPGRSPSAPAPTFPAAEPAAPVAQPPSPPAAVAAAPEPTAEALPEPASPALDEDVAKALLEEETVRDRLYRLALEEEARQRFDDSLEQSGITAEEIEGGVKRLFETVRVEPVLERAGHMDGMVLRSLDEGHPFHRAGFREGDRLTRLDDWALDDAGTLPEILIRLKRTFVACAVSADSAREVCRPVTVDAAG